MGELGIAIDPTSNPSLHAFLAERPHGFLDWRLRMGA